MLRDFLLLSSATMTDPGSPAGRRVGIAALMLGCLGMAGWFRKARRAVSAENETEKGRLREEVHEGDERFSSLFHQVLVGVVQADLSGRLLLVNRRFCEMLGRSEGELLRLRMQDITHPDDLAANVELFTDLAQDGGSFVVEKRYLRPDGTTVWAENSVTLIRGLDGSPRHLVAVSHDITERKRHEEELRRDREEQATMTRIGRVLAAELDLERLVQALTDEATAVTGAQFGAFFYNVVRPNQESYTLYTLSGVPREAFARFPMPRNTHVFGPTFRGEGLIRSDDITRDPRYGQNPPYSGMPPGHLPVRSYLAAPVMSRSGEVLGGLFFGHQQTGMFSAREERILAGIAVQAGVAIDNAQLYRQAREARAVAEAASRSKDEFLATVSHELRTPLNAVLGWAQILQISDDAEKQRRGLGIIVRNAKLQTQLIDDLLDVSRIISGKMRLDVRAVDLPQVVDAAVEAIRPAAEAKQIRLVRLLDPQAGPVSGDAERLQQVVWNLLSNAVKFTPRGGRAEVRLERVGSQVEIVVADTGMGIDEEFLPQVFDRFRQLDSSTTRKHGGLGLGLAIVRHLAELHGGTVEAQSPGEGQGTTFIVRLPISVAHLDASPDLRVHPSAENPAAGLDDPALDLRGIRVLVVDDEADARETLIQILEHCGAKALAVSTVDGALEALAAFRPDVLLSDIGMPEQDGYDLIRRVRGLAPEEGGTVPAAALTAFARSEDRRRSFLAGFQMHVAKPVEVRELAAVVANLARGTASEPRPLWPPE